jgi:hypothetical protein
MEDWHILFASTFLIGLLIYIILPKFLQPGFFFQLDSKLRSKDLTLRIEDSYFQGMITDIQRVELLNRVSTNSITLLLIRRKLNRILSVENSKRNGGEIIPKDWYDSSHPLIISKFKFHKDVVSDIREMVDCANNGNHRASLTMAGRVLEQILNQLLDDHEISIDTNFGIGKKIGLARESDIYFDPAMMDIWNIINKQRIAGVHAKETVPIPSKDQVLMVIHAIKDCLSRILKNED